jgi:hypothetical protein
MDKTMTLRMKSLNKLLVTGIFFAIIAVYGKELGDLPYVILFITVSVVLAGYMIIKCFNQSVDLRVSRSRCGLCLLDTLLSKVLLIIWIGIIYSWVYGFLLGLVNGVPIKFASRNFFGLIMYIFFPILLLIRPTLKSLFVAVILGGGIQIFYGLVATYKRLLDPTLFIVENSLSEVRSMYSTGFVVIFPLFVSSLAYFLVHKNIYSIPVGSVVINLTKKIYFLGITLFALVVPAMSKGMILSTILLAFFVEIVSLHHFLRRKVIKKACLIFSAVLIVLGTYLVINFGDIIFHTFSSDEVSNSIRNEQYKYLVNEFSLLGSGLGAALHSGYSRDETGYGFELTYINIIHKLGICSFFLLCSYVLTLFVAFIRIWRCQLVFESIFVVGLMGYLVVGSGNPLLLSSVCVVLHCIGMYILVSPLINPLPDDYSHKYNPEKAE